MWGDILTPHGPCSYCYSPYHHVKECPTVGQFSNNFSEHMNTQFSRLKNEPYCDSYHSGWSNQSDIPWQAQAPKSYAPQFHELYHPTYLQFNDQAANVTPTPLFWLAEEPSTYATHVSFSGSSSLSGVLLNSSRKSASA